MLENTPFVILDEATSILDNEAKVIVQKAMNKFMQNRTVFIIAQRLSTIKNVNRIAFINQGDLETYKELKNILNEQCRVFYEMQK